MTISKLMALVILGLCQFIFSNYSYAQCGQLWEVEKYTNDLCSKSDAYKYSVCQRRSIQPQQALPPSPGQVLAQCSGKFQLILALYQRQYDAGQKTQDLKESIGDYKEAAILYGNIATKFISIDEMVKIRDQETLSQVNVLTGLGTTAKVDAWVREATIGCDNNLKTFKSAFGTCKGF